MRLNGEVWEIRAEALRFSVPEAEEMLATTVRVHARWPDDWTRCSTCVSPCRQDPAPGVLPEEPDHGPGSGARREPQPNRVGPGQPTEPHVRLRGAVHRGVSASD